MATPDVAPANVSLWMKAGEATRFKRGQVALNKGVPMSEEQKIKCRASWRTRPNVAPDLSPVPPLLAGQKLSHASLNVRRWRAAAFVELGDRCTHCGFADVRALQIDHINGGGRKDRAQHKSSPRKFYKDVIKEGKRKFQLLCANCNQIKRVEEGE